SGSTRTISTTAAAAGLSGNAFTLLDAWTGANSTTTGAISASVPAHGTVVYRVSRSGATSSPSPTPTVSLSLSPSPTWRPTSPPTGSAACQVSYRITGQWTGGFQADVSIRNTGTTPIDGWNLRWNFTDGQQISQAWNATVTQTGDQVTATNAAWNAAVAPGATVSLGFLGTATGANTSPASFTLGQTACTTA
ncbi:cellulose binding domain-containing protein, partial [Paractinoplanes ferrugineus]